jgi:general nucleoside transport system ATP-binding protein
MGVEGRANELIQQYDIRTPSALTNVGSLSGGNQQKVIVARELSRPIKLLIASQPTRGLDIGSIEYIHGQILQRRDDGVGVLLVSTELDEVLQLSDRIAVMYRGKIVAVVPAEEATKGYIGLLMAGIPPEQAKQRVEETQEHADKGGILG